MLVDSYRSTKNIRPRSHFEGADNVSLTTLFTGSGRSRQEIVAVGFCQFICSTRRHGVGLSLLGLCIHGPLALFLHL